MKSKWFPATRMTMNSWEYFTLKMSFADFFHEDDDTKNLIKFNKEFEKPDLLDEEMQRELDESRAKKSIVEYLMKEDAFFGSVVIACLGDIPEWHHLKPTQDVLGNLNLEKRENLGYVRLDQTQKYYVLDGQHRLFAIKEILRNSDILEEFGGIEKFKDTTINVILVNRGEDEDKANFKTKYRRLFTSLNRYAKATSTESNIIMDEDDAAAILTRRLIRELPIFECQEKPTDNTNINCKSENLSKNTQYFTSLATFYEMNITLLQVTRNRTVQGIMTYKDYKRERPNDETLDMLYEPLKKQWEAMFEIFPEFTDLSFRKNSRDPNADLDSVKNDFMFLRPACQKKLLAPLMKKLIDDAEDEDDDFKTILSPLKIEGYDWDLRKPPFVNLLLVETQNKKGSWSWKIVEGTTGTGTRLDLAKEICTYLIEDEAEWNIDRLRDLKSTVLPALEDKGIRCSRAFKKNWWDALLDIKQN
mgnify:CR=1 FL=1